MASTPERWRSRRARMRSFMAALRRWRRAELTRIAWRDLAGWASLDETLEDLSRAAERAVRLAHEFADSALRATLWHPALESAAKHSG